MGQQYLQIYGVPGAVNAAIYPYGQLGQAIPSGHGFTAMQSYAMPGHQIVPHGVTNVNSMTTSPMPTVQAPYPTGTLVYHEYLFLWLRLCISVAFQKCFVFFTWIDLIHAALTFCVMESGHNPYMICVLAIGCLLRCLFLWGMNAYKSGNQQSIENTGARNHIGFKKCWYTKNA